MPDQRHDQLQVRRVQQVPRKPLHTVHVLFADIRRRIAVGITTRPHLQSGTLYSPSGTLATSRAPVRRDEAVSLVRSLSTEEDDLLDSELAVRRRGSAQSGRDNIAMVSVPSDPPSTKVCH